MISAVMDPDLRVAIENHLPTRLAVGRATAVFCYGHCFHRRGRVADLAVLVDGVRHRPAASRMPRRDLYEWLHSSRGDDPRGHSYRSGFWATLPIPAGDRPGAVEIEAAVRLADGGEQIVPLGRIEIAAASKQDWPGEPPRPDTIAICMATHEPELELFAAQIRSLREQTDDRWICVMSDDATSQARYAQMLEVVGGDPRFFVSRSAERAGPYRNFERALELAPADARLLAPSDQDDRWYPDKLSVLRGALGDAGLVYSDQRLVSADGGVLRESLWEGRRNDWRNLASLLVANTIPGAAMLLRREIAERALPFPNVPGAWYHDHWLALAALASGEIAYVDRPLYDYVQHPTAVSGDLVRRGPPPSTTGSRGLRSAYFGGYVAREVQARTLLMRCADVLTVRKRRGLQWFISASRSLVAFAWLAGRPLRRFVGRDETLGGEWALTRGILWRWLLPIAARRPGRRAYDASFPDPPRFEQARLRRWRSAA
jgi:hypothetical protein